MFKWNNLFYILLIVDHLIWQKLHRWLLNPYMEWSLWPWCDINMRLIKTFKKLKTYSGKLIYINDLTVQWKYNIFRNLEMNNLNKTRGYSRLLNKLTLIKIFPLRYVYTWESLIISPTCFKFIALILGDSDFNPVSTFNL